MALQKTVWAGLALLTMALGAGTACADGSTPLYVVSYYELISPTQNPAALKMPTAIFQDYKRALSQEKGAVSAQLLQDQNRPGHYTMIEVWSDQKAYAAHQVAASEQQFTSDVTPWLAGPADIRLYSAFQ